MLDAPQRVPADPGELLLPGHLAGLIVEDDQRLARVDVVRFRFESLLQRRCVGRRHRHRRLEPLLPRLVAVDLSLDVGIRPQRCGGYLLPARDCEYEAGRASRSHSDAVQPRHPRRRIAAQQAIDARAEQPGAVDADRMPRHAVLTGADRLGHVEEHFRIAARLTEPACGGFVAGMLGSDGERAFQPPGERMEPEERTVDGREEGHQRIATDDVRVLVCEYGIQRGARPAAPRCRQQHAWRENAGRHRRGDRRRLEHRRAVLPGDAGGGGNQTATENPATCDSQEEEQHAGCVEDERGSPPAHAGPLITGPPLAMRSCRDRGQLQRR